MALLLFNMMVWVPAAYDFNRINFSGSPPIPNFHWQFCFLDIFINTIVPVAGFTPAGKSSYSLQDNLYLHYYIQTRIWLRPKLEFTNYFG
jgi:hypothetical protein